MPVGIIESLDHEGRGITRLDGKTIFVEGALPGERIAYTSHRVKRTYEVAHLDRVLRPSGERVAPRCPHFGVCGGCSMQHLAPEAQVAAKQRVLEDSLWHLARLRPQQLYAPIHGIPWGYRHRARLGAHLVPGHGMVLGFHERKSSYIADLDECPNLPPAISALIVPLRELIAALSLRDRVPQVEIAVGERVTVIVLRILQALAPRDTPLLRAFAERHGVQIHLQPKGPDSGYPLHPAEAPPLSYSLPDYGVELHFGPTEFTQVNPAINRSLIRRAMALLAPRPGARIADLFCGLGNFTLPIARLGADVVGIEGSSALVRRAADNAARNGLAARCRFAVDNLFEATPERLARLGPLDGLLIDPPREGAVEVVKSLGPLRPRRIVYVSCNPATLARDAAVLVNVQGYTLEGAGIVNMFPNTSHVESIALFTHP